MNVKIERDTQHQQIGVCQGVTDNTEMLKTPPPPNKKRSNKIVKQINK